MPLVFLSLARNPGHGTFPSTIMIVRQNVSFTRLSIVYDVTFHKRWNTFCPGSPLYLLFGINFSLSLSLYLILFVGIFLLEQILVNSVMLVKLVSNLSALMVRTADVRTSMASMRYTRALVIPSFVGIFITSTTKVRCLWGESRALARRRNVTCCLLFARGPCKVMDIRVFDVMFRG